MILVLRLAPDVPGLYYGLRIGCAGRASTYIYSNNMFPKAELQAQYGSTAGAPVDSVKQ